jgi:hypothetical protein
VFITRMTPDGVIDPLMDVREQPGDTGFFPSLAVDEAGNVQIAWSAVAVKGGKLIQTRHSIRTAVSGRSRTSGSGRASTRRFP